MIAKTQDGVEFVPGMTLWDHDGNLIETDPGEQPRMCGWPRVGDHVIEMLFSSKEALESFLNSEINKCFVCQRLLDGSGRHFPSGDQIEDISMINDAALFFRATGNYGSTIFDPSNYQILEIVICDKCVYDRRSQIRHASDPENIAFDRQWPLHEPRG